MAEQIRIEGPTPSGGEYAIVTFADDDGMPADEATATRCSIVEYDASGERVAETFGECSRQ